MQLILISKILGNDKSRIPNFKLANKSKNTNLRCQELHRDRRFPCGKQIHVGLRVISQNFISQLLPQKKLEILAT